MNLNKNELDENEKYGILILEKNLGHINPLFIIRLRKWNVIPPPPAHIVILIVNVFYCLREKAICVGY
jgi:hypothetical protein